MQNSRIVPLGSLAAPGVTEWVRLSLRLVELSRIQAAQVTANGTVTGADVNIEHSIDGVGAMPLLNVVLSSTTQSDGATSVGLTTVFVRMRLKSISGAGSVAGTLVVED